MDGDELKQGRRARWSSFAFVVACVWIAWRSMLRLELLGWDSYPLIAAGRFESAADWLGTLREPLMDGRYPLGHYWRPLVHYSFALDHAIWGLTPFGYHLTDVLILCANAVLLTLLASRFFVSRWCVIAGVYFAFHDVHVDVLQAPARRADALALMFTLLALVTTLSFVKRPAIRCVATAMCCVLALMSKETGAVAVVAVVLVHFIVGREHGVVARTTRALREAWPALAGFALTFAGRAAVLGGLGGARESSLSSALLEAPDTLARYAPTLLAPPLLRSFGAWSMSLSIVVAAALALGCIEALRRVRARSARELAQPFASVLLFCVAWFVVLALTTALSGAERGWYELPFTAPATLLYFALFALAFEAAGRRSFVVALFVTPLVLAGVQFRTRAIPMELAEASDAERRFLDAFENAVRGAQRGEVVRVAGFVPEIACSAPALEGRARSVTMLAPYSVQAYADLVFGVGRVALVDPRHSVVPPGAVGVVLTR